MIDDYEMTPEAFGSWLARQKHGESVVYFHGTGLASGLTGDKCEIGTAVWRAYENGLVELTQRRVNLPTEQNLYGTFDYIATRV